jgi:MFS family permease
MDARGISEYVGPFVVAGLLTFASTTIIFLFLRPDPKDVGERVALEEAALHPESIDNIVANRRPLREIFAAPMVQLAILSMTIGYFVMAFLMVITPLHMSHHDHNTTNISNVIMLHTLGMFGLAPLTGWLIDRVGRIAIILTGSVILISACILAPLSLRVPVLGLALFLLGLGWNFCYVAGSSLLLNALAAHERGRAQGASEAIVAVGAGSASLLVGIVFARTDYLGVSVVGLVASVLMIVATLWLVNRDRKLAKARVAA